MRFFLKLLTPKYIFAVLFLGSLFLLLGRFYVTRSVAGGDAVYYYITLRSLVIDRDLNFANEYHHFASTVSPFTGNPKIREIPKPTITGRLPNKYPTGSAILLSPFFALAHLLALTLKAVGVSLSADGYGAIYQLSAGIGSLIYGFAGLLLIFLLGRRLYEPKASLLSTSFILLATPLIYYLTMEPLMSHSLSFFVISLFIFLWYHLRKKGRVYHFALLGAIGGLAGIVRYQDGFFLLIPVIDLVILSFRRRRDEVLLFARYGLRLAMFIFGAVLALLPQLYVNRVLYGSFFTTGYAGESFPYWKMPKLLYTLFSPASGLILWSPIIAFSLVGLLFLSRRDRLFGSLLFFAFLAQWYLVSSWWSPDQGDSFGNRMLLNCIPIFAFGLMELFQRIKKREGLYKTVLILSFLFVLINGVLAGLYCFRIIGNPY